MAIEGYTDFALSQDELDLLTEGLRMVYRERLARYRMQEVGRPSDLARILSEIVKLSKKLGDQDV